MLEAEHLQFITGCLLKSDMDELASHLLDGEFEAARAVLERAIKTMPSERMPNNEDEFTSVLCNCASSDRFLAVYRNFRQKLDDEPKANAGRPDVCMVYSQNGTTCALVIELKFGKRGHSAVMGLQQVVDKQYVERAIKYVNMRMQESLNKPPTLELCNVLYLSLKLNQNKSVSIELPTRGSVAVRTSPKGKQVRAGAAKSAPPAAL